MSGHDHSGDDAPIMGVVPPSATPYAPEPPVAGSRRANALLWMGALLGATAITAVFLGVVYFDASSDVDDLRGELAQVATEHNDAKEALAAATASAKLYYDDNQSIIRETNEMRARLRLPARPPEPPRQNNPFSDPD